MNELLVLFYVCFGLFKCPPGLNSTAAADDRPDRVI